MSAVERLFVAATVVAVGLLLVLPVLVSLVRLFAEVRL